MLLQEYLQFLINSLIKMKSKIEAWIMDWFKDKSPDTNLDINDNYFEKNAIDSFGIMELITDIETHYEITFSQDDFQDPRFANIEGLSNILMEKIGNSS